MITDKGFNQHFPVHNHADMNSFVNNCLDFVPITFQLESYWTDQNKHFIQLFSNKLLLLSYFSYVLPF